MNTERCSCGAREKNKCNKESEHNSGKMCLKDYKPIPIELLERMGIIVKKAEENKAFDELTEKLWKEHPEEMAEANIWAQEFIEEIKREPNNRT